MKNIKLKHGLIAILLTLFVVAGIILVNVIAIALSNKYNLQVDMTKSKYNSLTDDNIFFIKKIDADTSIMVLAEENSYLTTDFLANMGIADDSNDGYAVQAKKYLEEYHKYNPKITVKYIDPQAPDFAEFIKDYPGENIQLGDIIVKSEKSFQILKIADVLSLYPEESYFTVSSSTMEAALSSAILKVTSGSPIKTAIITGHNCDPSDSLSALLESNNFQISGVTALDSEGIEEGTRLLIINSPATDFTADEIKALEDFLNKDKNMLFYISDYTQPPLKKLEEFLKKWGIAPMDGIIFETDSKRYFANEFNISFDYLGQNYEALAEKGLFSITYNHRPFALAEDAEGITASPLLGTPNSALLYRSEDEKNGLFPSAAKDGPFYGALLSTKKTDNKSSYIFALGGKLFLKKEVLTHQRYGNSDFILITLQKSLEKSSNAVYFAPKVIGTESALVDYYIANLVGTWLLMVLLPLTVLSFGIYIYIKRSHR